MLGARVVPGYFSQTHDRPDLVGRVTLDILMASGLGRGRRDGDLASLRAVVGRGDQVFDTLSGGQQARLQILLLELSGSTLLLLDEPTDNLDVVSAEALESALGRVRGHGARR